MCGEADYGGGLAGLFVNMALSQVLIRKNVLALGVCRIRSGKRALIFSHLLPEDFSKF